MPHVLKTLFVGALAGVISYTSAVAGSESLTWYVYCEGGDQNRSWAIISENTWIYPRSDSYSRRVGSAAKVYYEKKHEMRIEGCSGVSFTDLSLAEYSRRRTEILHRQMGDNVYHFELPEQARVEDEPPLAVRTPKYPEPVPAVSTAGEVSADRPTQVGPSHRWRER